MKTLIKLIMSSRDLHELCVALNNAQDHLNYLMNNSDHDFNNHRSIFERNLAELPIFSTKDIDIENDVYSYDDTHNIIYDGIWKIVKRD